MGSSERPLPLTLATGREGHRFVELPGEPTRRSSPEREMVSEAAAERVELVADQTTAFWETLRNQTEKV